MAAAIERARLRDEFQRLFEDEAAKRSERVGRDSDGLPEWVSLERAVLVFRINQERQARGKEPITFDDYDRRELTCMGHTDYSSKLALACMELVLDY